MTRNLDPNSLRDSYYTASNRVPRIIDVPINIKVALVGLCGPKHASEIPSSTMIGDLLYGWHSDHIIDLVQTQFRYNHKALELYGLSSPIASLAVDGHVKILYTLRLGAYPLTLGLVKNDYDQYVADIITSKSYTPERDRSIATKYGCIEQLSMIYSQSGRLPVANDIDPITLEPIERPMRWIESGKVFAMDYQSAVDYVKGFVFTDDSGFQQIPNPFTRQPIPEPWRYDFLALLPQKNAPISEQNSDWSENWCTEFELG